MAAARAPGFGTALVCCVFASLLSCACSSLTPVGPNSFKGFIKATAGRFVDEACNEFPVVGMNGWQLMESAAGVANFTEVDGLDAVQYTFAQAAKDGQTVVRVFGHGINSTLQLQEAPGVYNERAFAGLDYVLDVAASYGVRVLFTMADYWLGVDSFDSYVNWTNLVDPDQFFYEDAPRQIFKDHMYAMTNRRNTVNGLLYKEDPTIFAWDLMNEVRCNCFPASLSVALPPSCSPTCADNVTVWITEMSAYLKSLDSNHLVTVGEEGYWASYDPMSAYNPGNGWASITGQNFTAQHSPSTIDFAAIHFWPDLWTPNDTDITNQFLDNWVRYHEIAAKALGKPLILEEFGKNITIGYGNGPLQQSIRERRLPIFQHIYGMLNASLAEGNSLRGVMFWQWGMNPQNSDANNIEVAAHDVDYQTVVVPSATNALLFSQQSSPVGNCTVVSQTPPAAGGSPLSPPGSVANISVASVQNAG